MKSYFKRIVCVAASSAAIAGGVPNSLAGQEFDLVSEQSQSEAKKTPWENLLFELQFEVASHLPATDLIALGKAYASCETIVQELLLDLRTFSFTDANVKNVFSNGEIFKRKALLLSRENFKRQWLQYLPLNKASSIQFQSHNGATFIYGEDPYLMEEPTKDHELLTNEATRRQRLEDLNKLPEPLLRLYKNKLNRIALDLRDMKGTYLLLSAFLEQPNIAPEQVNGGRRLVAALALMSFKSGKSQEQDEAIQFLESYLTDSELISLAQFRANSGT